MTSLPFCAVPAVPVLVALLLLQPAPPARAQDAPPVPDEVAPEGEDEGALTDGEQVPRVEFPVVESLDASEPVDPAALLDGAIEHMGGMEKLDELRTISFEERSWIWRANALFHYERLVVRGYLREDPAAIEIPAGRVDVPSDLNFRTGQPKGVAFVANGDDRFMLMDLLVLVHDFNELEAGRVVKNEMWLPLIPYWVKRYGSELSYDGIATIESFRPQGFIEPVESEDGSMVDAGFVDYQPVTMRLRQVTAEVPATFREGAGDRVRLWFDDDGRLVRFRCHAYGSEDYGNAIVTYDVEEVADAGGLQLPARLTASYRRSARIVETLELGNFELNPQLPERLLKRP